MQSVLRRFNSLEESIQYKRNRKVDIILSYVRTDLFFKKIINQTEYRQFFNEYPLNDQRWLECVTNLLMMRINVFGSSIRQRYGNPKYDFISLANNLKIETKARCIHYHWVNGNKIYSCHNFKVERNKRADIFVLFLFDNVLDLNLKDIYVIGRDEEIKSGKKIGDFVQISISNSGEIARNLEKLKLKVGDMVELRKELEIFKNTYRNELIKNINQEIEIINRSDRKRQLTFFDYENL